MSEYFNAGEILPAELTHEVLKHLPESSRNGALVYFSEDYYAKRNAEIVTCFRIYQSDPHFGSLPEIYEALSEQYGLSVRRICAILKDAGEQSERARQGQRRFSGVRVDRNSRRMSVRAASSCRSAGRR